MSAEREVRKETDFWGNEREYIYEDGERVGELRLEERGGFFGIGAETVKVERDKDGDEVGYTRQESRGGILGIGAEDQEVRYDSSGEEIGYSRVEARGGILGIGDRHVRVEYDKDGVEVSQTNTERRGDFLGIGGERVRVTRSTKNEPGNKRNTASSEVTSWSSAPAADSGASPSSGGGAGAFAFLVILLVGGTFFFQRSGPVSNAPPPSVAVDGTSQTYVPPLPVAPDVPAPQALPVGMVDGGFNARWGFFKVSLHASVEVSSGDIVYCDSGVGRRVALQILEVDDQRSFASARPTNGSESCANASTVYLLQ